MKALGLTNFHKNRVYITRALKDIGPWGDTFWHEWMQAVAFQGGYNRITDNEAYIEYMAQALMRLLSDPIGNELVKQMVRRLAPAKW